MSAYTILRTNGSKFIDINDGAIDQTSSDITLIGKNTSGYGLYINDNFFHLLENFANSTQPTQPQTGQLWFDTSENRLKVYDGITFKVSGGTIVSNTPPSSLTTGDIWLDNKRQQMYFNDGNSTKLAGPIYTADQGQSGFVVGDIVDVNSGNHTVVYLYVSRVLMGIFSKDAFTPATTIAGFSGNISVGFNASSYAGVAFNVLTSKASALQGADGSLKTAENFVSTTDNSSTTGTLTIQNSIPLTLGVNSNFDINVGLTGNLFNIKSNILNQNFEVSLLNGTGLLPSLYIDSTTQHVGIYTNTPQATLDVNGNVLIEGNLTVNGSTTTVNSTTVNILDKVIVLGETASPTDTTAEGGGIQLAGTTTKSITWNGNSTAWSSTENFNLLTGKTYKINGFDVVTGNSLGSVITSAPGLTSVGSLTSLTVSNLSINNGTISFSNVVQTNGDIILLPKGSGSVSVSSKNIIDVAAPVSQTDAANKLYVDQSIQAAPLGISLTTLGLTNTQIASQLLTTIFPPAEHQNNTVCRVQCSDLTIRLFLLVSGAWQYQNNL